MADTTAPAISLRDVSKYFYKGDMRITAVSQISFDVRPGSFVSILGPSGCGKSTILNMLTGPEKPDEGSVYCGGKQIQGIAVGIGYLTQHDALLPWRTLEDNVRLPLEIQGQRLGRLESRSEQVERVLQLVGLSGFQRHLPRELSGGMRKRAALAQALVYAREIVAMDEPFGALDFQMRLQMQSALLNIWSAETRTIVFVTHDIEEAVALSDEIIILSRRPGRIREIVPVDLPRPRDPMMLRSEPRFQELCRHLWSQIEPPALSAQQ